MTGAPPPLSITPARAGGRRVLVVEGEVGLDSAAHLNAAVARVAGHREPVVADLSGTDVAGTAGAALVVHALRRMHRLHETGDVAVVAPPPPVRAALHRSGLARRVAVHDDWDALGLPLFDEDEASDALPQDPDAARQRRLTPARRGALLAEATLAIERRHADPVLSLDDVAREIATSSRQLQRVFAELAGSAFRDELAAVRMQHGAALLQTTRLPVAEIARRVGYRQSAQFAKAFRRVHGVSPSAFRRAARG